MASAPNGRSSRTGSTKTVIVLKLSPELLSRFPSDSLKSTPTKATDSNMNTTNASSPVKEKEGSPASSMADVPVPPSDNASDANSTPAGAASTDTPRRKGLPAPKPGAKRGANQIDSAPKPRGKPGPKKKQKLDDGTVEQPKVATGHRLGPKANAGAINAGLRALDRTGAPCRKWERKPLQLKSFTGIHWQLPSWRTPKPPKVEENGDSKAAVLDTAETDSKVNNSASNVPSEKSNSGDGGLTPVPPPMVEISSPAIPMAT